MKKFSLLLIPFLICFQLEGWAGAGPSAQAFQPEFFFNQGLDFRNAGSPILAALWFRAYRETQPESGKSQVISEEINRLEALSKTKVQELIQLALEGAGRIPDDYFDEKQEAFERLAHLQAISGRIDEAFQTGQSAGLSKTKSFYLRYLGEYLVASRDYEGVQAVFSQITEPAEAKRLLFTLGRYQILRNERQAALLTLRRISPSPERAELLNRLAALYTRELNVRSAELLLKETTSASEKRLLSRNLLLGYLKAGQPEEAKKLASQMIKSEKEIPKAERDGSRMERAVLGQGLEVLKEIREIKPDPRAPWRPVSETYAVTVASAWMGELTLARNGCSLIRELLGQTPNKDAVDYAEIACATVESEEGNFSKVLETTAKLSSGSEMEFAVSLFWRLVYQKRFDVTKKLIDFIQNPGVKATLMQRLAQVLSEEGKRAEAHEWIQKSFELATAFNLGFVLRDIADLLVKEGELELAQEVAQTERVTRWTFLAKEFQSREAITNLQEYLKKSQTDDLRSTTSRLTQAAGEWLSAMTFIRSEEKLKLHE